MEQVRYLPPLDFGTDASEPEAGRQVMPCFPLSSESYVPETTQRLNVFEPRYRQMYSDLLLSGGRRFVVPQVVQEEGTGDIRLSEVGVVFYLEDLKEVSQQTGQQIKYIGSHTVIGRVRMRRVLNPRAFADRSTYLKVEVEALEDSDLDIDSSGLERKLMETAFEVGALQDEAEPELVFRDEVLPRHNATRGAGFWSLVELWQNLLSLRIQQRERLFSQAMRDKIVRYFQESPRDDPAQSVLNELPVELERELIGLQTRLEEEVGPMREALARRLQVLVQCESHRERLEILQRIVDHDRRRLQARLALRRALDE